jgi:hypothetical protein
MSRTPYTRALQVTYLTKNVGFYCLENEKNEAANGIYYDYDLSTLLIQCKPALL